MRAVVKNRKPVTQVMSWKMCMDNTEILLLADNRVNRTLLPEALLTRLSCGRKGDVRTCARSENSEQVTLMSTCTLQIILLCTNVNVKAPPPPECAVRGPPCDRVAAKSAEY